MLDVYQYPVSFVTERYLRLGLSARKGNKIQQALLNNNVLTSANISIDRKIIKILGLTEQGRNTLGIKTQSSREGGLVHRYWQYRLAEHLKACGYKVEIEAPVGDGKAIDIVAERDGKRIAFEIETGNSDVAGNVRKCLESSFDQIVVIAVSVAAKLTLSKGFLPDRRIILQTASETLGQQNW
jgi:hypothetical protein